MLALQQGNAGQGCTRGISDPGQLAAFACLLTHPPLLVAHHPSGLQRNHGHPCFGPRCQPKAGTVTALCWATPLPWHKCERCCLP